jgi:hypothetical protein
MLCNSLSTLWQVTANPDLAIVNANHMKEYAKGRLNFTTHKTNRQKTKYLKKGDSWR